jgi:hypothetical protein
MAAPPLWVIFDSFSGDCQLVDVHFCPQAPYHEDRASLDLPINDMPALSTDG